MTTIANSGPPPVETWPRRACEGKDTSLWFPGPGEAAVWAKRTCWTCAARRHCAAYAIPIEGLAGIWGAMSAKERTEVRNRNKKEA